MSFKCPFEASISLLPLQFAPRWLSGKFPIGEYAVSAQVSSPDGAAKPLTQIG